MGLMAGVADLTLLFHGKTYFFELKTEVGRQTTKQKEWQKTVESQGFDYSIIRTLGEFKKHIQNICGKLN